MLLIVKQVQKTAVIRSKLIGRSYKTTIPAINNIHTEEKMASDKVQKTDEEWKKQFELD